MFRFIPTILLLFISSPSLFFPRSLLAQSEIGVILPLSGDFARYGQEIQKGLEKARAKSTEYIYEDEGCNPQKAITAYKKLSSLNQIKFFLGPWCGSPQTTIAPLLPGAKQIAILGSSAPQNVFISSKGRMFSTQHTIEQESEFNARKAYEMGARKVVILFFENDFSRAHEKAFQEAFAGEVLKTLTYHSQDASVLKGLALQIKRLAPDTLYLPDAFPLMHGLLKELKTIQSGHKRIFSVYSAQSEDVLKVLTPFADNFYYSYPRIGDKVALEYFPEKASEILIAASKACGTQDSVCALEYLQKNYAFDEHGVLKGDIGLKTIKDGKFTWLKPL